MLDGLEATELRLSEVLLDNEDFRCDSEYFQKSHLAKLRQIENVGFDYVGDFAFVTDGIHESIDYCDDSPIALVSAQSPKENVFDLSGDFHICEEQHERNPRTALRVGDVVVSSVGTIGNCAVVDESILPANSDRHVGILRITQTYLPYFVSTFLIGKYGRFQTLREATGNVQLNLFIYRFRKLKIPRLTKRFQSRIEGTVQAAHQELFKSKGLYREAERLLLDELGLKNWRPPNESIAVKSFAESFGTTGRIDAEYYQPKYDEAFRKMQRQTNRNGWRVERLGALSSPLKYGTSENLEYVEEGVPFLRITDVTDHRFDRANLKYISGEAARGQKHSGVQSGDVIVSRSGTLGLAIAIPKALHGAIFGSYFIRTRPDSTVLDADYLALYLNSLIGRLQVERANTGAIQTNLTIPAIESIRIAIPPGTIQKSLRTE